MARYFKVKGTSHIDTKQLQSVLSTNTFYPNFASTPPLPEFAGGTYDKDFDFRQFWVLLGIMEDGSCVIYTRTDEDAATVMTNARDEEEWSLRYGMAEAPVATEMEKEEYTKYINTTSRSIFLSYSYDINVFNYTPPTP
jgi:hypothetical protein